MSTPVYDVDYFIEKFKSIPEEKWCTEEFSDGGRCCALGLCGERCEPIRTAEGMALAKLLPSKAIVSGMISEGVVRINDRRDGRYQQPTPKQRILAALCDIKRAAK